MTTTAESTILLLIVLFASLIGCIFALVIILVSQRLKRLEIEQTHFWLQESKKVEQRKMDYIENLPLKKLPLTLKVQAAMPPTKSGVLVGESSLTKGKGRRGESSKGLLVSPVIRGNGLSAISGHESPTALLENDEVIRSIYKPASWQGAI